MATNGGRHFEMPLKLKIINKIETITDKMIQNKDSFLKESLAKSSILAIILVKLCLNFQFSNALRIIEIVPFLKKLKVWTLYVHIVAQVNHKGLGVKVETNCLRDSDLIPRHSFLSMGF